MVYTVLAGSGETAVVMVDWTSPHRLGVHDGFFLVPLIPKPEPKPSLDEQLARRIIEEGQMIEWVGQVGLVRSDNELAARVSERKKTLTKPARERERERANRLVTIAERKINQLAC